MKKGPKDRISISLDKTTAEQEILRSIDALASAIRKTTDSELKESLVEQMAALKEQMQMLGGPKYGQLLGENELLRKKLEEAEKKLSTVSHKCEPCLPDSLKSQIFSKDDELRHKLYRLILKKYSKVINDHDKKTVGELKALITDEDLTIQSLVSQFKGEGYGFPKDYLPSARKLFDFLTSNIDYISLDSDIRINFWLSPKEMISEKVADDEDFSVLLCSLLYSLGDHKAEVFVAELDNLETHAFVITTFDDKLLLLDPCVKKNFDYYLGSKQEVLGKYDFRGARIKKFLYRFNRFSYEQFIE